MGTHYFGMKVEGKLCRFFGSFTDEEFYPLVDQIGGTLPVGWKAWHFQEGEDIKSSKRIQAFAKLPEIKVRHWSGMYYSAPREQVAEELLKAVGK